MTTQNVRITDAQVEAALFAFFPMVDVRLYSERDKAHMRHALEAALPLTASEPLPGWRLVPIEPTEEMRNAAVYAELDIYWNYESAGRPGGPEDAWRAMIEAAPSPKEG